MIELISSKDDIAGVGSPIGAAVSRGIMATEGVPGRGPLGPRVATPGQRGAG